MILTENVILSKSKGLTRAATVKDLVRVKTINLWGQSITDVSFLVNMPQLEVISLAVNRITDLSPFEHVTCLRQLYLRKNLITHATQLLALRHLPHLIDLWIADNPVCDRIPSYRATMAHLFPRLQRLDDRDVVPSERTGPPPWGAAGDERAVAEWLRRLDERADGGAGASAGRPVWLEGGAGGRGARVGVPGLRDREAGAGAGPSALTPSEEALAASLGIRGTGAAAAGTSYHAADTHAPPSLLHHATHAAQPFPVSPQLSKGARLLQASDHELRRLAEAIAALEQKQTEAERREGDAGKRATVAIGEGRGDVNELLGLGLGRGGGGTRPRSLHAGEVQGAAGRIDDRPIRPMPGGRKGYAEAAASVSGAEWHGSARPDALFDQPHDDVGVGGGMFPVVSVQHGRRQGKTRPVDAVDEPSVRAGRSHGHGEDHLAHVAGIRVVEEEHHPPDGRILHLISHHPRNPSGGDPLQPDGGIAETAGGDVHPLAHFHRAFPLHPPQTHEVPDHPARRVLPDHAAEVPVVAAGPRYKDEDHLLGSGMGFVHGGHKVPAGRIAKKPLFEASVPHPANVFPEKPVPPFAMDEVAPGSKDETRWGDYHRTAKSEETKALIAATAAGLFAHPHHSSETTSAYTAPSLPPAPTIKPAAGKPTAAALAAAAASHDPLHLAHDRVRRGGGPAPFLAVSGVKVSPTGGSPSSVSPVSETSSGSAAAGAARVGPVAAVATRTEAVQAAKTAAASRPGWLEREGNETLIKNSIRGAGVKDLVSDDEGVSPVAQQQGVPSIDDLLRADRSDSQSVNKVSLRVKKGSGGISPQGMNDDETGGMDHLQWNLL
ncbi:hypothetical protein HDU96_002515 [Phlyctochytrium bullatum]|nr:hypothetical protein HDU96_002515 [Phlyctochytrium bullatum]